MFGISGAEFLVILIIAILVIPPKNWPEVAAFLAKIIKFIREMIWKITDASEQIKEQIELENPIDEIIKTTTDEVLSSFSTPIKDIKKALLSNEYKNNTGGLNKKPKAGAKSKVAHNKSNKSKPIAKSKTTKIINPKVLKKVKSKGVL